LFDEKFSRKKYYDFMFTYLSHYDRINFPYSEKMLVIVMNKFYSVEARDICPTQSKH